MTKLTKEQKDLYIRCGGVSCPFCGESDVTGGFIETEEGGASQPVHCDTCGEDWVDVLTITNVESEE